MASQYCPVCGTACNYDYRNDRYICKWHGDITHMLPEYREREMRRREKQRKKKEGEGMLGRLGQFLTGDKKEKKGKKGRRRR